jgi:hypothetical protein
LSAGIPNPRQNRHFQKNKRPPAHPFTGVRDWGATAALHLEKSGD